MSITSSSSGSQKNAPAEERRSLHLNKRVIMKPKLFLSHSSEDKAFVRLLDQQLRAYGAQTFLDERDILRDMKNTKLPF